MPNTNVLAHIACPKCGHNADFEIAVTGVVRVDDNGWSEYPRDTDFDDSSFIQCTSCHHSGKVLSFRTDILLSRIYDFLVANQLLPFIIPPIKTMGRYKGGFALVKAISDAGGMRKVREPFTIYAVRRLNGGNFRDMPSISA